jgi:branched-chain amino acid transport system substrate-binding protein
MSHEVFISYPHKDKVIADAVCAKLEEYKIRVWIAPRDVPPGTNFAGSIVDAIDNCKLFVLIWSANTNASEHILNELNQAFDDGTPVIPFRVENVEPSKALKYYIGRTHWLDAMNPPLEKHIVTLAETILTNLGRQAEIKPKPAVVKEKEIREEKKKEKEEGKKPASKPSAKPRAWWLYMVGLLGIAAVAMLMSTIFRQPAPIVTFTTPKDAWGEIVVPKGSEVKIGVSSPLSVSPPRSADYAIFGQETLNGVNLAVEKFGGRLKGFKVVTVSGDDQCEVAPTVTVATQFSADTHLLGVVGPQCSGTVVPASEVYSKAHILMISPSSSAVFVTAQGLENVFRIIPNDSQQAQAAADYLYNVLKVKTLGIVHDQSVYGLGVADAIQTYFKMVGGTITGYQGITDSDTDFSAVIATLVNGKPDAVYFSGMVDAGAMIVNQLRKAGFTGIFFGPDSINSKPSFVDQSGGSAEGAFMTLIAVGGKSGYDEFLAAFKAKFNSEPSAFGPGSYDAAMILLKAADAVAKVDNDGNLVIGRKALADKVRSTPFDGVTGHLEFTNTGDLSTMLITVLKVVNSEIVAQKEYQFIAGKLVN